MRINIGEVYETLEHPLVKVVATTCDFDLHGRKAFSGKVIESLDARVSVGHISDYWSVDNFKPSTGSIPFVDSKTNSIQIGGTHYQTPIQPWDYILANSLGFLEGNIIKYVTRYKAKNGVEDLKKARHYLDKLIEVTEAGKE